MDLDLFFVGWFMPSEAAAFGNAKEEEKEEIERAFDCVIPMDDGGREERGF